ncbi:Eco29kI restriction endonuclease [Beggiatoa alba B18LD]|uniref:Eco29kI restriction endonuclease n=1 Tax=Beggiatoa alba B18LD TaxID=395493 RepID=I3CCG5_9GAMM|nr:Eco29kI family restriction endonuclease [Beggiatoa alba]EIJ41308.1 Eco29kI restriction endonuclease [Beggiatoa alba B18LD]
MIREPFNRAKHIYHNAAFAELVKDAVRFFNGTPVHSLPPSERFLGSGVYALYYTGENPLYTRYKALNRLSYDFPIYVGKAVPKGWRQARTSDAMTTQSTELYSRLKEHSRSILSVNGLSLEDFSCRFVLFENEGSDMIGSIEATLIKLNQPLWNSCVDGFGNHDPGKGRYEQARSDWDVIHTGRVWAERLNGVPNNKNKILDKIEKHLKQLKKN